MKRFVHGVLFSPIALTTAFVAQQFLIGKAYALTLDTGGINVGGPGDIKSAIVSIANWLLTLVGVLAVLTIIIAGLRLIISQGDESQKETAKKAIIYAVVGIVVILLSAAIINLASDVFGG